MQIIADDFGLSENIDAAIIELSDQKKISGASVMVNYADDDRCQRLREKNIQIGLHLTDIIANTSKEVTSQFLKFEKIFKSQPAFIDGHRHVHAYPLISGRVIATIKAFNPPDDLWIRSTRLHPSLFSATTLSKKVYLGWINFIGRRFHQQLLDSGLKTNNYLWGVIAGHTQIDNCFRLAEEFGDNQDIIICHPGLIAEHSINRSLDYNFLKNMKTKALNPLI